MKIVFASHTHLQSPFVVGSHHLARNLAKKGHQVMHIATSVSPLHLLKMRDVDIRRRFSRAYKCVEEVEAGLFEYIPFSLLPAKMNIANNCEFNPLLKGAIPGVSSVLRKHGFDKVDLALIDQRAFWGLWRHMDASKWVYRPTDLYADSGSSNIRDKRWEQCILNRVDSVVATSQPVLEHVNHVSSRALPGLILRNGVDVDHFISVHELPNEFNSIKEPRVVYAGALDDRFNWKLVEELASSMPSVNFILIGPNKSGKSLSGANVYMLGARDYKELPAYFQHSNIGLLPLSDHPENRGRSPMKFYEYIASNLPIVATETPEFKKRPLAGVYLCNGADSFKYSINSALENKMSVRNLNRELLDEVSWSNITDKLLNFLSPVE